MNSVVALSERSIAAGNSSVQCPDNTHGKLKVKKPVHIHHKLKWFMVWAA